MTPEPPDATASDTGTSGSGGQTGSVSIEALADRVYRLLLTEAREERARGTPRARWRER
jgi:hypothetical protein